MIEEYVHSLERQIHALGSQVSGFDIVPQKREEEFAFISGEIQFSDGTYLHFREYVELNEDHAPRRFKYACHYQHADGKVIFRYDNARHFMNLPGAPHHKHLGENDVVASEQPDLQAVLQEIEGMSGA